MIEDTESTLNSFKTQKYPKMSPNNSADRTDFFYNDDLLSPVTHLSTDSSTASDGTPSDSNFYDYLLSSNTKKNSNISKDLFEVFNFSNQNSVLADASREVIPDYILLSNISSDLYRGFNKKTKRSVLVKYTSYVSAGSITRFFNEWYTLSGLNTSENQDGSFTTEKNVGPRTLPSNIDGILYPVDFVTLKDNQGYAMVYDDVLNLKSLKEVFVINSIDDKSKILTTIIQTLRILKKVHEHNFTHNGLTASNILINDMNEIYITGWDFCFPYDTEDCTRGYRTLNKRYLIDWLPYMAPEVSGEVNRLADYRADFYSIGIILYQLSVGFLPFIASDGRDLINKHIREIPEPPEESNVDKFLNDVIMKLLAKNASDRYQSCDFLIDDLVYSLTGVECDSGEMNERQLKFTLPRGLYGRESSLSDIKNLYNNMTPGVRLLLLTGQTGTGKTKLVNEIQTFVASNNQYFVSWKCSPRINGFGCYLSILNSLIHQILSSNDAQIGQCRECIFDVISSDLSPLYDFLPELKDLLGQNYTKHIMNINAGNTDMLPAKPELKFKYLLKSLFAALGRTFPITLFFDDFQWFSVSDLDLLREVNALIAKDGLKSRLMILATFDTSLKVNLQKFKRNIDFEFLEFQMPNLSLEPYVEYTKEFMVPKGLNLQDKNMSRSTKGFDIQVQSVSKELYEKSKGNALTSILMIQHLYLNNMIHYDSSSNGRPIWSVDFNKFQDIPSSNEQLYQQRLNQFFNDDDLEMFKYISCIFDKTSFSLNDLSIVSQKSFQEVAKFLSKAIQYNLIYPVNIFYKFPFHLEKELLPFEIIDVDINDLSKLALFCPVHDSLHLFLQKSLMSEEKLSQYHKVCGLRLYNSKDEDFIEDDMTSCLEIANHFCKSYESVNNREDINTYLKVLKATQRFCYKLFDFIPALKFLNVSKILIERTNDKKALYTLHVEIVKCSVMVKNFEGCLDFIKRHSPNFQSDPVIVLCTMRCLEMLDRVDECVKVGVDCLKKKGINIEEGDQWNKENVENLKSSFPTSLAAIRTLSDIRKSDNRKVSVIQEIMAEVMFSVVSSGKIDLITSLSYTMVAHAIENGKSGFLALGFIGIALGEIKSSKARAQEYAHLGISLLKKKPESFDFANHVYYIYCFTIGSFLEPIENLLKFHDMAILSYRHYSSRFATGFVMTVAVKPLLKLFSGENVQTVYNNLMRSVNRSEMEDKTNLFYFKHAVKFFRTLLNLPYDDRYDLEEDPEFKLDEQSLHFKCFYHALQLHYVSVSDNFKEPKHVVDKRLEKFQADYPVTIYSVLTMATRAFHALDDPHIPLDVKKEVISEYLDFLKFCRYNSPKLFEPRMFLFEAEVAKLENASDLEVLDAYSTAIEKAEFHGLHYDIGNINERCGTWLHRISTNKKRATKHLREAAKNFHMSGHLKRVYLLKKSFPDIFDKFDFEDIGDGRRQSEGNIGSLNLLLSTVLQKDGDQIDEILDPELENSNVISVIKASLAISESINFDSIVENLVKHTIDISGAEYAVVSLLNEDRVLEYKAVGGAHYVNILKNQDSNLSFPDGLIREVIGNGRPMSNYDSYFNFEQLYTSDPFFYKHQPKSMLCIPIKNELETLGALYLESSKDLRVFHERKLNLAGLLCTQAAFALDKARLYKRTMMAKRAAEDATAEKATFLANMSHEIRTPFNSLFACAGFLLDTKLDAIQHEYVETIQSSAKVTLNIIDAILTFSKIEHGSLYLENADFSLNECIESAMHLVAEQAVAKNLEIAYFNETEGADTVKGDLTRFRQIIINLLGNSVKFTQDGSVIVKSLAKRISADGIYEFVISIKDSGIGIPKSSYNKVFGAFSQVDGSSRRVYGGSGLGLAISKKLVELMGGNLTFESKEGEGTTFYLSITSKIEDVAKPSEKMDIKGKAVIFDGNGLGSESLKVELERLSHLEVTLKQEFDYELSQKSDVVFININFYDQVKDKNVFTSSSKHSVVILSPYGKLVPEDLHDDEIPVLLLPFQRAKLHTILKNVIHPKTTNAPTKPQLTKRQSSMKVLLSEEVPLDILLVEDNMINTKVALQHLRRLGYKADSAVHGVEALSKCAKRIEETGRNYDLILMDIQMPLKDGIETSKDLEKLYGDTELLPTIVALTANVEMEDRDRCISCGMSDFISKPILPERLTKVLRTAGQSRSHEIS